MHIESNARWREKPSGTPVGLTHIDSNSGCLQYLLGFYGATLIESSQGGDEHHTCDSRSIFFMNTHDIGRPDQRRWLPRPVSTKPWRA